MTRRIAVLGGGHGARAIAADMTLAGHTVTLFEFERFRSPVSALFETSQIELQGHARTGLAKIHQTTHNLAEAISDAELILIVVPALAHQAYATALASHLQDGANIVLVPGTFGSLEFLHLLKTHGCQAKNITLSEWDTLPYAARIQTPTSVKVFHNLQTFGMGVYPATQAQRIESLVKDLYPNVTLYRNVLEAGLSNCNPIIHPLGVLMNAGRIEYSRGDFYYYEEGITLSTAKAMEALDDERIMLGAALGLSLPRQSEVLHAVGYGPQGDLWEVLKGSKGLTPIKGPMALSNRYVTEDIPIGLVFWSQLGDRLQVSTPLMKATIELGIAISGENYWQTGRTLDRCGIAAMNAQELIAYVS